MLIGFLVLLIVILFPFALFAGVIAYVSLKNKPIGHIISDAIKLGIRTL